MIGRFNIEKNDEYTALLKNFLTDDNFPEKHTASNSVNIEKINENTLLIKAVNGRLRRKIHALCDKIVLHHESDSMSSGNWSKKNLYIYKPPVWLWEYTERNPYGDRSNLKHCCECHKDQWETQLYESVYIDGIYCEDCLDTVSDGEGGVLNDHKFELSRS